jgi:diguanylate cyclase (GGDEF)-like protein
LTTDKAGIIKSLEAAKVLLGEIGIVGQILIMSSQPEERGFLFALFRPHGLVETAPTVEKASSLLASSTFPIVVLDAEAAGDPRLRESLLSAPCLVLSGRDEDKLKEAARSWPDDRFVDYIVVSGKPADDARARRVAATAREVARLKADVADLASSKDAAERKLRRVFVEIKDLGPALSSGVRREIEKRAALQARYSWFQALKRKFEDILRKLYAANDVPNLLSSVVDVKDLVGASSLSIYILEENEALGRYLKPLVWDDAYLAHADFSRHIARLQATDFAAEVARKGAIINLTEPAGDPRCARRYLEHLRVPLRSLLGLPLEHDAGVIGVLEVYNRAEDGSGNRGFTAEDQEILRSLSEHIAMAMTKLNLIQYDALTGLLRPDPFFQKVLQKLESHTKRRQETGSFAMVMGDVDWFKHYNDRNGHEAGNRLLQELSAVLKSVVREGDLLCRYGGEEFLFFLTGIGSLAEATLLTERIRKTVADHVFEYEQFQPRHDLTMCFGVTLVPGEAPGLPETVTKATLKTIAGEADLALAEAKGKRMSALRMDERLITKNRVCAFVRDTSTVVSKTSILKADQERITIERRKNPRYYTSTICLYPEPEGQKVGNTLDLSLGGVRLSAEAEFGPAETLDLVLVLGNRASTVSGDVVHCRKASPAAGVYYTGIRFRDLAPRDREALKDFFHSLERREIPSA